MMIRTTTQRLFQRNSNINNNTNTAPHYQIIRSASNLSGLQRQVLGLYRKLLRTSSQKDNQPFLVSFSDPDSTTFAIKNKFRDTAGKLSKRDVDRVEYNIRQGEKYVKILQMNNVKSMKSR